MVRIRTDRVAAGAAGGTARSHLLPSGQPILETKLALPRWRHRLISRSRLLDRLDAERDVPLVATIAPAGYGKSALLADWVERTARRTAWLTLDDRDVDPPVLLGYLAVAVDRATALPPAVFETLAASNGSIWTAAVPQLGGALAAAADPLLLVVDEADRLGASPAFEALVALAAHLPPGSQLALGMRQTNGLPIARLLAARMMTLVEREDLTLDDDEAAELLRAEGTPMPADEVRAINRAAEGWAAGISFRALAERAGGAGLNGVDPLAATEHLVAEYLREEVLDRLAPDEVRFLLRASVLDRLSAPLVDAVLNSDDAASSLRALDATTLLLTPLDQHGEWYRWHRMARDVLQAELLRREPGLAPILNRRAAMWHEAAGQREAAVEYALRAGDDERVNRLLPGAAEAAYNAGRVDTVRSWFEWLETREAPVTPVAASAGTILLALIGDTGRAHRWAAIAAAAPNPQAASHEEGARSLARAYLAEDGATCMRQDAELAVRDLPPPHGWAPVARVVHGVALALACADGADRELGIAIELAMVAGSARTSAAIGLAFRAALAIRRSDWGAADEHIRQARRIVIDARLVDHAAGILVHAMAARIAARRGAVRQAESDARHVERLRTTLSHAIPWLAIRIRLDLGATLLALGDRSGARVMLDEIRTVLRWQPDMGILVDECEELRMHVEASEAWPRSRSLTAAELRLLPLLATHLSFREIARGRNVSANTVKTQAKSIYRKLDAGSRSDAVLHARAFGLLEPATTPEQPAQPPERRA